MPLISLKALIETVIKWTQVKNEPSSLRAKPHAAQHQPSRLPINDNMMARDRGIVATARTLLEVDHDPRP